MPLDDRSAKSTETYLYLEFNHEEADRWLTENGWFLNANKPDWMLAIMDGDKHIGYFWYQYGSVKDDPQSNLRTMLCHAYVAPQFRPTKWSPRLLEEIYQLPTLLGIERLIGTSEGPEGRHKIADVMAWDLLPGHNDIYFTLLPRGANHG
tara:strand:- start:975 stop:1424 length:450 start_codon:yes stop_codon:yes gene_type:complete